MTAGGRYGISCCRAISSACSKDGRVSTHGVEALSDLSLCLFPRDALWELHRAMPRIGFDVTWLAAQEESLVDENLLSVGWRSAEERIASLLIILYKRAAALLPQGGTGGVVFPLTQQHIADSMGLSLVHTNKTLRRPERRGLHRIGGGDGRLYLWTRSRWRRSPTCTAMARPTSGR